MHELSDYPSEHTDVVLPFRVNVPAGTLSFFSTTMVFGTPVDITLAELAVESFFAADTSTTEIVRRMSEAAADHLPAT
jgi:hypothetical protein